MDKHLDGKTSRLRRTKVGTVDALADFWANSFPYEKVAEILGLTDGDRELLGQRFALFTQDMRVHGAHAHFETFDEWRKAMVPPVARVELGAYVGNDAAGSRRPIDAPMVFDLDADDYANILLSHQVPGKETPMNELAWDQMARSATLLHLWIRYVLLKGDEETSRVLAVFSGRRGIHLWYPNLRRDWANVRDTEEIVAAIGRLSLPHHAQNFRELLTHHADASPILAEAAAWAKRTFDDMAFESRIAANPTLYAFFKSVQNTPKTSRQYRARLETAGLLLFAPRIDTEVTKSYVHLVKSPFSVHPATGNISMPFRPTLPLPPLSYVLLNIRDGDCSERIERALADLSDSNY